MAACRGLILCGSRRPVLAWGIFTSRGAAKRASPAVKAVMDAAEDDADSASDENALTSKNGRVPTWYETLQTGFRDHIILYQKGKFFELWSDDAIAACKAVPLSRNQSGLAGFPHHRSPEWIPKILESGHTLAVVTQTQSSKRSSWLSSLVPAEWLNEPKQGKSKSAVPFTRAVTRIITPGTLPIDMKSSDGTQNVLAIFPDDAGEQVSLSWVDTVTGSIGSGTCKKEEILDHIARISPREILILHEDEQEGGPRRVPLPSDNIPIVRPTAFSPSAIKRLLADNGLDGLRDVYVTAVPRKWADADSSKMKVFSTMFLADDTAWLKTLPRAAQNVLGMALSYLAVTMQDDLPRLRRHGEYVGREHLEMDAVTRETLELLGSSSQKRVKGSLLWVLDHTSTKGGRRMLRERIAMPLTSVPLIRRRQGLVALLVDNRGLLGHVRSELKRCSDLQQHAQELVRCCGAGLQSDNVLGGVLLSIQECLGIAGKLNQLFNDFLASDAVREADSEGLAELKTSLKALSDPRLQAMVQCCENSIADGAIRDGVSAPLDAARKEVTIATAKIHQLYDGYKKQLSINKEFRSSPDEKKLMLVELPEEGWMLETLTSFQELFDPAVFVRCKAKSRSVQRFTTSDLMKAQRALEDSRRQQADLESSALREVALTLEKQVDLIGAVAEALSNLDVAASLADAAVMNDFTRPTIVEEPILEIKNGAHAVVANIQSDLQFVRNSCSLTKDSRMWIITGPNMGGKSTFLRQNALIVIMAQMGSFVPAESAVVGIVDNIFTRIGASDNLAENKSTFMVEMEETARIVRKATPRSLVVLDEIGRGTSVADGLAIASAVCHHLASSVRCRTLFATHFHQLSTLSATVPSIASHHVAVPALEGDHLVFTHHIQPGTAEQSQGLVVARLAGLPDNVLQHARTIKTQLDGVLAKVDKDVAVAVAVPSAREGDHPRTNK